MNLSNEITYQKYDREYITNHSSSIKRQLEVIANSLCYHHLRPDYISSSIKNFKGGYIYRDTTNYNNIAAFVLWSIRKSGPSSPNELYIRIICGKKLGRLMFYDIESFAVANNIKTIILSPINDTIKNHYINNYGFKLRGYDKQIGYNIYYKNLISYNTFNRRHTTLKRKNKTNNMRRKMTLKTRIINNNLNNFFNAFQSHKIINIGKNGRGPAARGGRL